MEICDGGFKQTSNPGVDWALGRSTYVGMVGKKTSVITVNAISQAKLIVSSHVTLTRQMLFLKGYYSFSK